MRYISHYAEYPIYEPAEGGYYYAGNQLVESERKSKRACKRQFEEILKKCMEENKNNGFLNSNKSDWNEISRKTGIFPWIFVPGRNCIWKDSYLIGEGESYVIERKQGRQESGWQPYC